MTKEVAPSLDTLLTSDNPAWLWDGEQARIVWANPAGTSWFDAETLFDLIDVRFDPAEPAVAAIQKTSQRLPRGQKQELTLDFAAAKTRQPIACDCHVHALADGRSGLLVCARASSVDDVALPAAMQTMALGVLPLPICVQGGSGQTLYQNDAMRNLLAQAGLSTLCDKTDDIVATSFEAGVTSSVMEFDAKTGNRAVRIICRPLETQDRLADSSFLLVLEDITERRKLERSLLAGAEGKNAKPYADTDTATAQSSSDLQKSPAHTGSNKTGIDNEVAKALTALRQEIEQQAPGSKKSRASERETTAAKYFSEPPHVSNRLSSKTPSGDEADEQRADATHQVPDIVRSTLNNLPQPLVLVGQDGKLLFANDVAVTLMGTKTWQDIDEQTTLGDALAALEGEDGEISLFTANDEAINLDVIMSSFPWKDGPVFQATLSPGNDGEAADNRRSTSGKKKRKKLKK